MVAVRQGDIWWATTDKRRPVLVVTRPDVVDFLQRLVVAPITRTVRNIPTEIPLGPADGLPHDCAASFDNLQTVLRRQLNDKAGELGARSQELICGAIQAMANC